MASALLSAVLPAQAGHQHPALPPLSGFGGQNILTGVDALNDDDAWAVGNITQGDREWTGLLLHWDGTSWRQFTPPDGEFFLEGVDVIDHDDAWAVGREFLQDGSGNDVPVTLHWDGISWSRQATPQVPDNAQLYAVAGTAADDVWAVGHFTPPHGTQWRTFAMHWDGSTWQPMPVPPGEQGWHLPDLTSVVAVARDDAWAVGSYQPHGTKSDRTLAMHWDGQSWSHVDSPSPGYGNVASFSGVSADGAGNVWAVGVHVTHAWYESRPLVERWDGTRWKRLAVLSSGRYIQGLYDVSVVDGHAWAVGIKAREGASGWHALTTEWNGDRWVAHRSRSPGHADSTYLLGVSMTQQGTGFAVGFYQGSNGFAPFLERWDGTSWLRQSFSV